MRDRDQHPSPGESPFETEGEMYSIETVTQLTQVSRHQIVVYCRHGLISPLHRPEDEGWWFDDDAIRVLRRIEHLRVRYDMNQEGLGIMVQLMHEVERLREEVRALRRR